MRIAMRLLTGIALPLAFGLITPPALSAGVLQCVPYARELSGVSIRGDAWTWWEQAKGRYRRGYEPRPGAVLALANTDVMPLGHVAVVSRIIDERHILVRHANWSSPGLIERDVMAVDSSVDNDWSQVRIWWGQSQQMGARDNPVNGFIYPDIVSERAVYDPGDTDRPLIEGRRMLFARADGANETNRPAHPRLAIDPSLFREASSNQVSNGRVERTLAMIVGDLRREARLR